MAVGPLRGGGFPAIKPLTAKPQAEGQQPAKVLQKAVDGVLKPGQHLVLPARTGLAHLADHFDARATPDYGKLLKGEARADAPARAADEAPHTAESHGAEAASFHDAAEQALAMMDLLPPVIVAPPPPPPMQAREPAEPEEPGALERHREEPWPEDSGDGSEEDDDDVLGPAPELEPRSLELRGGVFTLDEGSTDAREKRLCTLEAFLDGDVPFVSCAVDLEAIPYGASLSIPALDAAVGRPVRLRAVHQTARTEGAGTACLEVCVSEPTETWRAVLDTIVRVELG